ncbi:transcription antitermination factor NusB [Lacrimispora sp.]|jgi:N utilization substance protein B|uniref:transcription antitermination factor NusB n=1 Tax=Lacrimispora sp. TaxID=2719234 RepID=UPI0028A5A4FD|nr:transcription antitermination factor NusB [Lacrimispora sp.]
MTRSKMREHCFKLLFCVDFYPAEEKEAQLIHYFEEPMEYDFDKEGKEEIIHDVSMSGEYADQLKERAKAVMSKIPELDLKINEVAEGWKTKRMGRAELTILRLALYEIMFDDEVPEKVAINEAVELGKKFGGNEAPAFVNGVLAKLV